MTASRPLCPAPADDGPPQPLTEPGPTRTLYRLEGSSDPSTAASGSSELVQCPRDDRQMSFGGSELSLHGWIAAALWQPVGKARFKKVTVPFPGVSSTAHLRGEQGEREIGF
jgi:hypothetical protein